MSSRSLLGIVALVAKPWKPCRTLPSMRSHGAMRTVLGLAIAATAAVIATTAISLPATNAVAAEETVGKRPYEMEWVGRTVDTRPPTLDFENLDGWTITTQDATASFARSREQQLWGQGVGRLVYRAAGKNPSVTIKPPKPVTLPKPFDCINFWIYGNNWSWVHDPSTPPVDIYLLLRGRNNTPVRIHVTRVAWQEWWVAHRRLTAEESALLQDGGTFEGIEVVGGRNEKDRLLFFDNLTFYQEPLAPLRFDPRPARNLRPLPGAIVGTNTGPGTLPFPTREETILPTNADADAKVSLEKVGEAYVWNYRGRDGRLTYRYQPKTGDLGDVSVQWADARGWSREFQPMVGGGVVPVAAKSDQPDAKDPPQLLECKRDGDVVTARWKSIRRLKPLEWTLTFRVWGKSLVIDVFQPGGETHEVRFGKAVGLQNPRLVTLPYLMGGAQRPAVAIDGPPERPLFLMGLVDHCRSNGSMLFAVNEKTAAGVTYNGGSRYLPKTDGRRNDGSERLFLTVAPTFEEVLPNIPNPVSPWKHVTGERIWYAHGAGNRENDYTFWKRVVRHGMEKVLVTDHESGWRDGGESFTMRTRAAPGKGGDEGQRDYARKMHALGLRYGIYNNYTDYAPVNEFWNEDYVTRLSDGQWRTAWPRCYNPKPSRAVELEARLAPIIQEKFSLNTAYCDVHTAVTPWDYVDFDARVPGAGAFASTFYAYGEIMMHQKKTWNGPVYSEGNNHWYYCGLTDGNYGQDQAARLATRPWLVDFDLRKIHPLCCNFGMGNQEMFFGNNEWHKSPQATERAMDRFLAATLAFGHTGFLAVNAGMPMAARSYFHLQQVQTRYAQEEVASIQYADAQGKLHDTTAATANGAFERSQVRVTYANGLEVTVNGHPTAAWRLPECVLPPNGWSVRDPQGGKLVAWSRLVGEHRADYVDSPAYLYADGRGRTVAFDKAICDGQIAMIPRKGDAREVIPITPCKTLGVSLDGRTATAVALDEEGKTIGPAEIRFSRGMAFIQPVPKAFSYLLTPGAVEKPRLTSATAEAIPGQTVIVRGRARHTLDVPADAAYGSQVWGHWEDAWIDFRVVPLVDASCTVEDRVAVIRLRSNCKKPLDAIVAFAGQTKPTRLEPGKVAQQRFPVPYDAEGVKQMTLGVVAGKMRFTKDWWISVQRGAVRLAELPHEFTSGVCRRGGKEQPMDDSGANASWADGACGGVVKMSLGMHPPYLGGPTGYAFATFGPIALPKDRPAALRCLTGKGDGSDPGDGILFKVVAVDETDRETVVAEKTHTPHAWNPLTADLSAWQGRSIRLKLVVDPGPANNSSGDWARWADLRVETLDESILTPTVSDTRPSP